MTRMLSYIAPLALSLSACLVDPAPETREEIVDEVAVMEGALRTPTLPPSNTFTTCTVRTEGPEGRETAFFARNEIAFTRTSRPSSSFGGSSCADLQIKCAATSAPVCAVVGRNAPATFTNRCQLLAATLKAAGKLGSAQGRVQREGPCEAPPTARACFASDDCDAGQHCSTEDGVCDPPPGCREPGRLCPTICTGLCVPN